MTRSILVLNATGEGRPEEAWDTQTSGLVVTRERFADGESGPGWVITHELSGCSVGPLTNDPENAMRIAAFLGADADGCPIDWTRDGAVIQVDKRAEKRMKESLELGAERLGSRQALPQELARVNR